MTANDQRPQATSDSLQAPVLFVGNGPYRNRGCEAIVRGTMTILDETFGTEIEARSGVMASPSTVAEQCAGEIDPRVRNFSISHVGSRLSLKWFKSQANARLGTQFHAHVQDLDEAARGVACALELGGDNYSLDYGRPWDYVAVDRYLFKRDIPVVLWGASVGPFESDAKFAPVIHQHLSRLDGIFVRETASRDYLSRHGIVDNVHLVADPAFCMNPEAPEDTSIQDLLMEGMLGVNISPLVARFSKIEGGLDAWRNKCASMLIATAELTDRPILLVPHVASPYHDEDDFAFMESLHRIVSSIVSVPIKVAPSTLNAAEMKWLISHCDVFAGARTHSTIAALSSCVPTLSLSYSVKAVGINQDLFGHQDFCISVKAITVEQFAASMAAMLREADSIRAKIGAELPTVISRAKVAGPKLAQILV